MLLASAQHPPNIPIMTELNRRNFIKSVSLASGSVLFFTSCRNQPGGYLFFTPDEALCVIALCEQIIPKDESPGATDAGVIYYIDRQLSTIFLYNQESYRNGILNLQSYCRQKYGKCFEMIDFDEQTKLLKKLETNNLKESDWNGGHASDFFNLLRSHTMQGFYGSPIHGGNKDYSSFRMLKIDYPLVIGQNRYRS
jgi:gluconate 2-dehydrogenase gamma chain